MVACENEMACENERLRREVGELKSAVGELKSANDRLMKQRGDAIAEAGARRQPAQR